MPTWLPTVLSILGGTATLGTIVWKVLERFGFARLFLARLVVEKEAAMLMVRQTYTEARKAFHAADSAGGEKLTPEEKVEAMRRAVERLKSAMGFEAIQRYLRIATGVDWHVPASIDKWLADLVEAEIARYKLAESDELPVVATSPTRPLRPLTTGGKP